jgi:DNA-binding MarR family transcriptional regulator
VATGPAKNVLVDVWMLGALSRSLVERLLRRSPLTPDEFAVYGLVVDLAPVTATDLTRATGLAGTTVASLVARCEARGDLERTVDPEDRRHRPLRLTEQGMARYRQALPGFAELLARIEAALPAPTPEVRWHLQGLDGALREIAGATSRPYRLDRPGAHHRVEYAGAPLSPEQHSEVLAYVDWIRHRDGHRDDGDREARGTLRTPAASAPPPPP